MYVFSCHTDAVYLIVGLHSPWHRDTMLNFFVSRPPAQLPRPPQPHFTTPLQSSLKGYKHSRKVRRQERKLSSPPSYSGCVRAQRVSAARVPLFGWQSLKFVASLPFRCQGYCILDDRLEQNLPNERYKVCRAIHRARSEGVGGHFITFHIFHEPHKSARAGLSA